MAVTLKLHGYNLFLNDSEYAPRPPISQQPVSDEKVCTQSVTPGTIVCRVTTEKPEPPKDYWWRSVIGTILCFPLGIVSLYRSSRVLPTYNKGEETLAQKHAKSAKKLSNLAVAIGIIVWMFGITYLLVNIEVTHR